MATLCFGGSFNPVHHGHLICARAVAEAAGFERVRLIPSRQPPHKADADDIAPAEHRLAMCHLAASEQTGLFVVDDLELRRIGPSYTLQTVRQMLQRGEGEVHWLIGADMLAILPAWHQAAALIREARFWIVARPGETIDWQALPAEYGFLRQQVVEAPLIDIRATDIRRRVAEGRSIAYLTPAPVVSFIHQNGLYREPG